MIDKRNHRAKIYWPALFHSVAINIQKNNFLSVEMVLHNVAMTIILCIIIYYFKLLLKALSYFYR